MEGMQPSSKELQGMASMIALDNGDNDPPITYDHHPPAAPHDDFFDQMLSTYPSWAASAAPDAAAKHLFNSLPFDDPGAGGGAYDESALLASLLRLHQISGAPSPKLLSQHMLAGGGGGGESGLAPLPDNEPAAVEGDGSFRSHSLGGDMQGLYDGFNGSSLPPPPQMASNQPQQHQNGSLGSPTFNAPASQPQASCGGGNGGAPRQRVRARRGQATDPHSIAERLRRERIAERMKALQELVPNANKTDKASMLDEIIDYVKFLQLQVKVLSMSRLGGAAAVAPLVADISSQAAGGLGRGRNGGQSTPGTDSLTVTEHQVAKLMEEDMGSAMQYLQGKGLCLMPISLASAISSATRSPNPLLGTGKGGGADAPLSPSISVLTVQSAIASNGCAETSAKDAPSVSKP